MSTKQVLGVDNLTLTADSGYFNFLGIKNCMDNGITPYIPEYSFSNKYSSAFPARGFQKVDLVYDKETGSYACPVGIKLVFRSWNARGDGTRQKIYWHLGNPCTSCRFCAMCTRNKTRGRSVIRWEHEDVIEALIQRTKTKDGLALIQKRKELCEHTFGTVKRAFNQGYLLLKGLRKVNGEAGFTISLTI
jgi:hypothetical protein